MTVVEYLENPHTKNKIISLLQENLALYQRINTAEEVQNFTGILYNHFVEECVHNNQYISLSNRSMTNITDIYTNLIINLRKTARTKYSRNDLEQLVTNHRNTLLYELKNTVYTDTISQPYIPCAEYSPEFQQSILKLTHKTLVEPILDIGCGQEYGLLRSLQKLGYTRVYGIDQFASSEPFIQCCNWFEYHFEKNTFGTILAHMSFTNHYRRSILAGDTKEPMYQRKYFEILRSLKPNGTFVYTPAVRTIEKQLDKTLYKITYYSNTKDENLDTVNIKRLR